MKPLHPEGLYLFIPLYFFPSFAAMWRICILIISISLFSSRPLAGQIVNIESLRGFADTLGFHGRENLNLSYTRNTRDLLTISNNLGMKYQTERSSWLFLNSITIQNANEQALQQNFFAHLRYNYSQNDWLTYEVFVQYQKDVPLRINHRNLIGIGPRFRLWRGKKNYLNAGLTLMNEIDDELDNEIVHRDIRLSSYLALGLASKDHLEWSAYLYYQPRPDVWRDFRTSLQTQLSLKIIKNLSFITALSLNYDAFPVVDPEIPGFTMNWTNGLTYSF